MPTAAGHAPPPPGPNFFTGAARRCPGGTSTLWKRAISRPRKPKMQGIHPTT